MLLPTEVVIGIQCLHLVAAQGAQPLGDANWTEVKGADLDGRTVWQVGGWSVTYYAEDGFTVANAITGFQWNGSVYVGSNGCWEASETSATIPK
jgi:hypothetical protein